MTAHQLKLILIFFGTFLAAQLVMWGIVFLWLHAFKGV